MGAEPADADTIFCAAIEFAPGESRRAHVANACGGNAELRAQVESLLAAHDAAGSFLESPPLTLYYSDSESAQEGPGTVIGPYKLLQQIGEGGMGAVFMAEQTRPVERTVALKIIKPGMDSRQVIARFEAERQALALMDHPNIARVLDAGTTESGKPYFVMDLVKGAPITEYCNRQQLSIRDRLELVAAVCNAVQHAHQKGIIHRDLKPSNVLVAEYDGRPVPKVIDFGVAKATSQRLTERTMFTQFGQLIGTFEYMSPEQARFNQLDIDTRSDIYSLGVLLYEVLAGSTPLEKERLKSAAVDEVLRLICEDEPARPSTRLSSSQMLPSISAQRRTEPAKLTRLVRGELDWIVMKCLEKDRNRRYETASALAADLQRFLHDEPVEARPATQLYRLRKFVHRNKVACTAAALVLAALVAGISAATWGLIESRRGMLLAESARHDLEGVNEQLSTQLSRAEAAERLANNQSDQLGQQLYDVKLPRAIAALKEGQFGIVRENLEACPADRRGWEWKWLSRQADIRTPVEIRGRQRPCVTPDGSQVAAVDGVDEKSVVFWNIVSGAVERTLAQSDRPIKTLQLDSSGTRLATGTDDGTIAIWDVPTGKPLWTAKAHEQRSDGFAFRPDGERLVSVSWDGSVKVFSVADGEEIVSTHIDDELRSVCYRPDGTQFVTAGRNNERTKSTPARIWDANSAKPIRELPGKAPRCATYSLNGRWIASGNYDGSVCIYDADSGQLRSTTAAHQGLISAVAFSPDSSRLATSGSDAIVRIWDVAHMKLITAIHDHASEVNFVAFSPNGQRCVSTDNSGNLHVWDMAAAESLMVIQVDSVAVRYNAVESVAFSPDGKRLLAGTNSGEVKLYDSAHLQEECDIAYFDCREVTFSPDGKQFAASSNGKFAIWDTADRKKIREFTGHAGWVDYVAFSPDGSKLVSAGFDETIRLWDVQSGAALHVLSGDTTGGTIWQAVFSPDGTQVASVGVRGLRVWDVESGSLLNTYMDSSVGAGLCTVAYSPNGSRIVMGGKDRLIHVLDAKTLAPLLRFPGAHAGEIRRLVFTPDGSRIVSGDATGMIRMWNADTGLPLLTLAESDGINVTGVAFSPDGNLLAAAKNDGTMWVWRLKSTPGEYQRTRAAQMASRIATNAAIEADWSEEALSAIGRDRTLDPRDKQLALRLAQDRIAVVPELAKLRLDWFRFTANVSGANCFDVNRYAWELLQVYPRRFRDPQEALSVAKKAVALNGESDAYVLDTLAVAYDANSDPAKAAEIEAQALEQTPPGDPLRRIYEQRLEEFQKAAAALNNAEKSNSVSE